MLDVGDERNCGFSALISCKDFPNKHHQDLPLATTWARPVFSMFQLMS
jgi:hypothetical protein